MLRRQTLASVALLMLLLSPAGIAGAAVPAGPRLSLLRATERPAALVIATSDVALGGQATMAGGGVRARLLPYPNSGPAWSPDGSLLAFSGMSGPVPGILRPRRRQLYVVGADGSGLRPIPNTRGGFAPVFAPDGETIAFAKTVRRFSRVNPRLGRIVRKGTTVWTVGLDGKQLRQLTPWEQGVEDFPSSYSPDGSVLGLTHRDVFHDRADAVGLRLGDRSSFVLAEDAGWPRYSPDGGRIAFLGIRRIGTTSCCELGDGFSIDLYAMNADRTSRRRLTDTPMKAERPASWDPSGQRLVYTTRSEPTEQTSGDLEAAVMQINADGSCPSRISVPTQGIAGNRTSFFFPAWQPGPGREAGRIDC